MVFRRQRSFFHARSERRHALHFAGDLNVLVVLRQNGRSDFRFVFRRRSVVCRGRSRNGGIHSVFFNIDRDGNLQHGIDEALRTVRRVEREAFFFSACFCQSKFKGDISAVVVLFRHVIFRFLVVLHARNGELGISYFVPVHRLDQTDEVVVISCQHGERAARFGTRRSFGVEVHAVRVDGRNDLV